MNRYENKRFSGLVLKVLDLGRKERDLKKKYASAKFHFTRMRTVIYF